MDRLGPPAQDCGVAALQTQRRDVGGHVRPRLVDHQDHPERDAHAPDLQAVWPVPHARDLAHRIRQRGHLAQASRHRRDPLAIERQALEQRRRQGILAPSREVHGVLGQDRLPGVLERIRALAQRCVLDVRAQLPQPLGSGPATAHQIGDQLGLDHLAHLS